MLRFLRKSLPNIRTRHRFLGKTVCLSVAMHACIAIIIVITMQSTRQSTIVICKNQTPVHARIVLIPFMKHVPSQSIAAGGQRKAPLLAARTVQPKKSSVSVQKTPTPLKTVQAKKIETKQEKPVLQPVKKAEQIKKQNQKKNEPAHKKQSAEKPQKKQNTLVEQKPIQKTELACAGKNEQQVQDSPEQVLYVGRDDLQELQFQAIVSQRVQKEWQPPAGAPVAAVCIVSFGIGSAGDAVDIVVVESSQSVLYDISARMAVARAHFEPALYGKKCQIVFKQ